MRLEEHWDLLTIALLSLLLDLLIALWPENPLRSALGLAFILFFPGYVFITALFPERDKLDDLERLALSFGLSIAIVPLIGLALNYTPFGIRLTPILVSLTVFVLALAVAAIYRREETREPWIPHLDLKAIRDGLEWDRSSKLDKALTVALLIAIIASTGVLGYVITHPKQGEPFTEFYILGPDRKASDYPTNLTEGEEAKVILGIVNHEQRNVTYHVEVWLVNLTYDSEANRTMIHSMYLMDYLNVTLPHVPVSVEGNWTPQWEENYTFSIDRPGRWQLWFLLFKDKRPPLPPTTRGGDYAPTEAARRIEEAVKGEVQSLKLNVEVTKP